VIVSHARRLLFVHVQKTGGNSVDQLLADVLPDATRVKGLPGTRHAKLRAALRQHPEFSDYFVLGFVRNPWARLWSWHQMIVIRAAAAERARYERVVARFEANNFWKRVAADYRDFEDFILKGTREVPRIGTPQLDWLRAPDRTADFIGRTEHLADDLTEALRRVGVDVAPDALERRNEGPRTDYREVYTPAMRDRVAEAFADDIEAFGYTF
jgi:hypothetical protein